MYNIYIYIHIYIYILYIYIYIYICTSYRFIHIYIYTYRGVEICLYVKTSTYIETCRHMSISDDFFFESKKQNHTTLDFVLVVNFRLFGSFIC